MRRLHPLGSLALAAAVLAGCSRPAEPAKAAAAPDQPPHGGAVVQLGDLYCLELVRDPAQGSLEAYVLDSEMETFIRVSDPSFEIAATVAGKPQVLAFRPVANPATGETAGQTSEFTAQADWLKTADRFGAVLTRIDVRGHIYSAVAFPFPQGNRKDE
ncbi:MAG TPA: hypothetical protein VHV47_06590 [Opitutaceae bacterium]|jgi:hypothetical protein|nr:hypothetical protein [Opitutaceae bacterium]